MSSILFTFLQEFFDKIGELKKMKVMKTKETTERKYCLNDCNNWICSMKKKGYLEHAIRLARIMHPQNKNAHFLRARSRIF